MARSNTINPQPKALQALRRRVADFDALQPRSGATPAQNDNSAPRPSRLVAARAFLLLFDDLRTSISKQTSNNFDIYMRDATREYLKQSNVPQAQWAIAATEVERALMKVLAEDRPKWDDRAKYPRLAALPSPEFLERVWGDMRMPDGQIDRDAVRDKKLLAVVSTYISQRISRSKDRGHATGVALPRGVGGRPRRNPVGINP